MTRGQRRHSFDAPSPSRKPGLPGLRQNEHDGFFVYVHPVPRLLVEADPESQTDVPLRSLARTPLDNALRSPPRKEGETVPAIARVLAQAASFLCDQPAAWRAADDAQRIALARMVFVQVRIKDDWVAAVEPQPSFTPFFRWDCHVQRL